jgi:glutamate-1-semialdehyde 2,1-aminomutase
MKGIAQSEDLYKQAIQRFPGGVNSPVRAFRGVGGTPIFMQRGQGAQIYDVDGNGYVDYVLSWGPLILGHAHPKVVDALRVAVEAGTSFGTPCPQELALAERIMRAMPHIERLRFVNSGTEATMSALRLARAYTSRPKIIKFEGCYHGHADSLLVKAGSGVATLGLPDSPGVTAGAAQDTLVARYNDLGSVQELMKRHPGDVAAVIVEPVAGNMGVIPPEPDFLKGLRRLTQEHGSLLIFDEVMTGFRVHPGGAQSLYDIHPDLTTLGKVIGGGLPVGAYGGRADIMALIAPEGPVYQAGTLSGNPLAMTAGLATLETMEAEGAWEKASAAAVGLHQGLQQVFAQAGIQAQITRVGTMMALFFTSEVPRDWQGVQRADKDRYAAFFHAMLERGVYLAPSAFEALFLSSAHEAAVIDRTLEAAEAALKSVLSS